MNEPDTLFTIGGHWFKSEILKFESWQRHDPPSIHYSQTSMDAATSIKPKAPTLRERVYQAIKNSPSGLTDEEICLVTLLGPSTARPRRIELAAETPPRIRSNGKRKTVSGRDATVWVVTNADS